MEKHIFKTATFGGFDKQDVANYIERTAQESAEQISRLEQVRDGLQEENEALRRELAEVRAQAEEASKRAEDLHTVLEQVQARADSLEKQQERMDILTARVAELEPEAESYRQFRDHIGDIECDARGRAAEMQRTANAKLRKSTAEFRERYQTLSAAFDTASSYITDELRKMEVSLSQLPRALDQMGAELQSLDDTLSDP